MLASLESIGSALPVLLLRISIVLVLAWTFQRLLPRRASAAVRHLGWTLALCGVLALPLLSAVVPAWTLEVRRVVAPAVPDIAAAPVASEAPSETSPSTASR